MALIVPSLPIADLRGPLGNVSFSRNRYASTARLRARPRHVGSQLQSDRIAAARDARRIWTHVLSNTIRQNWNDLAARSLIPNRFGEPVHPRGHNSFFALYTFSRSIGLPISVLVSPDKISPPFPQLFGYQDAQGSIWCAPQPLIASLPVNGPVAWFASPGQPQSVYRYFHSYRYITRWLLSSLAVAPRRLIHYSLVIADRRYFFRHRAFDYHNTLYPAGTFHVDT